MAELDTLHEILPQRKKVGREDVMASLLMFVRGNYEGICVEWREQFEHEVDEYIGNTDLAESKKVVFIDTLKKSSYYHCLVIKFHGCKKALQKEADIMWRDYKEIKLNGL